ncbi:MAG: peptide ABC transporter substrate-binding protein [Acidimicrobiaceae bacterium]|nr:peptide ABC transporter substrate-binding protein [Acidimicrobiaceae bacterium]
MIVAVGGCTGGASGRAPVELASRQVLKVGVTSDVRTLDPALIVPGDTEGSTAMMIANNVFGGLFRLDGRLDEVPDIATGPPQISADGLDYTFTLRPDAVFSNGDPVVAQDFVYSWNRVVVKEGAHASNFSAIRGYADLAAHRVAAMSGLVAGGDHTLRVTLSAPSGWFPTALAMWPAYVVDWRVIQARGEDDWWTSPAGLVGTGPFRMSDRVPGQSLDFVPIDRYWRGPTGVLRRVDIGIESSFDIAVRRYREGAYDVLAPLDLVKPFPKDLDQVGRGQVKLVPDAGADRILFNFDQGPFAGIDEGRKGRLALSLAIDRKALARAVCGIDQFCEPASGLIPEGLRGYRADDPAGRFDPGLARMLLDEWDPNRSKVRDLTYVYGSAPPLQTIAEDLHAQWKRNLGLDVKLVPVDPTIVDTQEGVYPMFHEGFIADYNHPQDWYDQFLSLAPPFFDNLPNYGRYANPSFDALVNRADREPVDRALGDYARADAVLANDAAYAPLIYLLRAYVIKPNVQGVGASAFFHDSPWSDVRILQS